MEDPVVPLGRDLYDHPLAGLLWERQFEKILLKHGWEKVSNRERLFVHREKGLFFSVCVDAIELAGKKQHIDPMWKVLSKEIDLGEPTSFLDHVYLGCTQRQCKISKDIVDNYRTMFESRISAGATEKLTYSENFRISSCLMTWKVMRRNVRSDIVSWRTRRLNNSTKYLLHALLTIISKKKIEIRGRIVKSMLSNCSENAFFLARIGRPDILWSVNKLARSITKWTEACDKRFSRMISYIYHTSEYKQYCHVGNTAKQCRVGLFQDSDFAVDLEDSKSTSGGTLCVFGSHTFVPISWMCKKQTSVSRSSTESEIISLDAG